MSDSTISLTEEQILLLCDILSESIKASQPVGNPRREMMWTILQIVHSTLPAAPVRTAQELLNEVVQRATQSNAWGGLGSFFFEKHAADTLLEVASEWGLSDPQELPSE